MAHDRDHEPFSPVATALNRGTDMHDDKVNVHVYDGPAAIAVEGRQVTHDGSANLGMPVGEQAHGDIGSQGADVNRKHGLEMVGEHVKEGEVGIEVDAEVLRDVANEGAGEHLDTHALGREVAPL